MTNDYDELEKIREIIEIATKKAILEAEEQTRKETWKYMKELTGLDVSNPNEVQKIHDVFNFSKGLMDKSNKVCDIGLTAITMALIGMIMTAIGIGLKGMLFKWKIHLLKQFFKEKMACTHQKGLRAFFL